MMRAITMVMIGVGGLIGLAATEACSSSKSDNPPANNPPDAGSPVDAGPKNQAECLQACETAHPAAAALNKDLDNCMLNICETVCDNLGTTGKLVPPSADAGVSCNTTAAKSYPITTASEACSDCLATNAGCCKTWIAIFGSDDGRQLNGCADECYTTFPH